MGLGALAVAVGLAVALVPAAGGPAMATTTGSRVPVVVCPTTFGMTPAPAPVSQPASVTVGIAPSLAATVALYVDNQGSMRLLGPRAWRCAAQFGADGSGGVQVYPPNQAPPSGPSSFPSLRQAVLGLQTSACLGCTLGQACPLFAAAAAAYHRDFMARCPLTRPARESVRAIGATVVGFTDPPGVRGDGIPSGGRYTAYGVLTYNPGAAQGSWLATCALPASERAVCAAGLALFARRYGRA